jgi:hypothetical protein
VRRLACGAVASAAVGLEGAESRLARAPARENEEGGEASEREDDESRLKRAGLVLEKADGGEDAKAEGFSAEGRRLRDAQRIKPEGDLLSEEGGLALSNEGDREEGAVLSVEGVLPVEAEPEELDAGELVEAANGAAPGRGTTPRSISCVRRRPSAGGDGGAAEVAVVDASETGVPSNEPEVSPGVDGSECDSEHSSDCGGAGKSDGAGVGVSVLREDPASARVLNSLVALPSVFIGYGVCTLGLELALEMR